MNGWFRSASDRTRKVAGSFDRVASIGQTLALVPELRTRFGITRVAQTTGLDRCAIPTYAAIVPSSRDLLSVYSGKGLTQGAAMLSAVMEAVERQIGAAPSYDTHCRPIADLVNELQLEDCNVDVQKRGSQVECAAGIDLYSGAPLSVPTSMLQCPWRGERLRPGGINTNGLASGNTRAEALYHALTEVIERHVWSLYHVRSVLVPQFFAGARTTDAPVAPEITFPTKNARLDDVAARIRDGGLEFRAFWLPETHLPHVMLVCITDHATAPPMAHIGMGCSLSPEHALLRAMSEAVQSRVVDIQGAREDIFRIGEDHAEISMHSRREAELPVGRWFFDVPATRLEFAQLLDFATNDVLKDIELLTQGLASYGKPVAAAVDMASTELPVSVVRVVIPSFETTAIDGSIRAYAARQFNPFTVC